MFRNRNEPELNILASSEWRASLVPAAAVIPAPLAYIYFAAVKTLVVVVRGRVLFCFERSERVPFLVQGLRY